MDAAGGLPLTRGWGGGNQWSLRGSGFGEAEWKNGEVGCVPGHLPQLPFFTWQSSHMQGLPPGHLLLEVTLILPSGCSEIILFNPEHCTQSPHGSQAQSVSPAAVSALVLLYAISLLPRSAFFPKVPKRDSDKFGCVQQRK